MDINELRARLLIEAADILIESTDNKIEETDKKIILEKNTKITNNTHIDTYVDKKLEEFEKMGYVSNVRDIIGCEMDGKLDDIGRTCLSKWVTKKYTAKQLFDYLKSSLHDCDFIFKAYIEEEDFYLFYLKVIGNKYYYETNGDTDYTDEQCWGSVRK